MCILMVLVNQLIDILLNHILTDVRCLHSYNEYISYTQPGIVTNQIVTNQIVTNQIVTNQIVTNQIVTNQIVTNEIVTNQIVTN